MEELDLLQLAQLLHRWQHERVRLAALEEILGRLVVLQQLLSERERERERTGRTVKDSGRPSNCTPFCVPAPGE
eukprot:COSAG03_NODE_8314_length_814_cov_2.193007_2_plen_74_part_00